MYELKPLHPEAVSAALEKAERYRLLNEAREAESICLDVLEVEPGNQRALVILLLAMTDQFEREVAGTLHRAQEVVARLEDPYSRAYYGGIVCEREAKARLKRGGPHSGTVAYEWLRRALDHFAEAERLKPAGNDDAILRWNTCVRILSTHPHVRPEAPEPVEHLLE